MKTYDDRRKGSAKKAIQYMLDKHRDNLQKQENTRRRELKEKIL